MTDSSYKTELETYIKLKHSGIFDNPEVYVNNLPDKMVEELFYTDTDWSLKEKRENAIIFYRDNRHHIALLKDEEYTNEQALIEYYTKEQSPTKYYTNDGY